MASLITDDMDDGLAVRGTPDAVAKGIVERFGDCDRICACSSDYRARDDLVADFVAAVRAAS